MKTIPRWMIAIALSAPALLVAAVGCDEGEPGHDEPGHVRPPAEPAQVQVSTPVRSAGVATFPATILSTDRARVATRASGTVRRIDAEVGSHVRKGARLVVLDAADVEAHVGEAQAAVRQATKHFERMQALAEDGAATPQELDNARASMEQARARLQGARAQQEYVVLRAPFEGVVTNRHAEPGDLAVPGQPLLTLVRPSSLHVEAEIPARAASALAEGQTVTVFDPDTERRYQARIARTSSALDRASRRIHVEATFAEGEAPTVLPGSFVRLEVDAPAHPTVWIPADAIVRQGQLAGVFVAEDDKLRLRWVRLGEQREGAVELLSGVPADARIVRHPESTHADGQPVSSVRSAKWAVRATR